MHVLVVGGTGILRPAATALLRSGEQVTVVARGVAPSVRGARPVAVDVTDTRALAAGLDDAIAAAGPIGLALAYAPTAPAGSLAELAARVHGRLVHVLVSRWGAPGADRIVRDRWAPDGAGSTVRVTLGWVAGPRGARWHTPAEVSRGVLDAARGDAPEVVLGTLEPWEQRPR
jgi:NAD(P)-dependent dehydrogenase (short-subunit alcohol dehydrogenase family)